MYSYCQMDANIHNVSVEVERKVNSLLGNVLIWLSFVFCKHSLC